MKSDKIQEKLRGKESVSWESEEIYEKVGKMVADGKISEAIDLVSAVIGERGTPELYSELGRIYLYNGDYEKAILAYEKSLNLDGSCYQSLIVLGYLYMHKREFDIALSYFRKVIDEHGDKDLGYRGMGDFLCAKGRYEEALVYYNKAIELDDRNAYTYNRRAKCYKNLIMDDKALDDYYKAVELEPEDADMYFDLGFELYKKGRYQEAIKNYEKVIELDPTNVSVYDSMGYTFFRMKNYEDAIKCYDKVIEIDPNNEWAIFHREEIQEYLSRKRRRERVKRRKRVNMKYLFVCYPKCSTCKKAQKWLDENNIEYEFRDIREENPTEEELKIWIEKSDYPIKRFFNTSGVLYREMKLKDKLQDMSYDEQVKLLSTDGMLVKRPIIVGEDIVLVGFKEEDWQALI